jgi:hypothetical protein
MRPRLSTVVLAAAGSLAASVAYRRRAARRRERVDLTFADGSSVSLADGTPEAARLLALAREVLDG